MTNMKVFENEEFGRIRTVVKDGEIWFVAMDVAQILEYEKPSKMYSRLEDDDKITLAVGDFAGSDLELTNSKIRKIVLINESGLYTAILGSQKPIAKRFKKWVTGEVLPSIRKHGIYATDEVIDQILNNPEFGIRLLQELKKERELRKEAERKNAILMHVSKAYTATEIAKEIGLRSAQELNQWLHGLHIQYKSNGTWVFYADYAGLGYDIIKQETLDSGKVVYHRKFTQYGRDFILDLAVKHLGYKPFDRPDPI